jgi:outer membrane usher protein
VIELRQRGQLVYRTVVAPGPYSLSEVGGLHGGADIEVKVSEEDGRVSRYTVPAPMANGPVNQPATYHLGFGRYRNEFYGAEGRREPWLAYGDYAYNFAPNIRFSGGALLSNDYQGTSALATVNVTDTSWIGAGLNTSHAAGRGLGYEWLLQGSASLGSNFYGALTWQSRSNGFRAFEDTLGDGMGHDYPARQQTLSGTLSWTSLKWGSYSYAVSHSSDHFGTSLSHSLTAGRQIGRASLNLSAQKSSNNGFALYLGMNMSLGKDSLSARFYQNPDQTQTYSAYYQGRPRADFNYQLQASRSSDTTRLSASAQAATAYSQLSGGISQTAQGQRSFYGSATGSVVMTGDGTLATSSSKAGDTFAIVKAPGANGVRLNASGGSGKVSALGTALIPNISPYRNGQIQVDGKSVPLNLRVENTLLETNLARGSVTTKTIGATTVRQLLLQVKLADGSFPTVGTSVLNDAGDFMGTVVGEGNVVLNNDEIGKPVYLETSGKIRCQLHYTAPEKFDAQRPYEESAGTCT